MKGKTSLTAFVLFVLSALAFCISAQGQTGKKEELRKKGVETAMPRDPLESLAEERKAMVQKALLIDKQVITLLQARMQRDDFFDAILMENGKVAYVQIPLSSFDRPTAFRNATLRIEMKDGSVQEIPLVDVKQVTIEQRGNIR